MFLIILAAILVAHFIVRHNLVGGCMTLIIILFIIGSCARMFGH